MKIKDLANLTNLVNYAYHRFAKGSTNKKDAKK